MFLAIWVIFILKTHWKCWYLQYLWKGASWNRKLHFQNSNIYATIFFQRGLQSHLEAQYEIQIFCHAITDTSKIRMFCFDFRCIMISDRIRSKVFWPPDKLKTKCTWHYQNQSPGVFFSKRLKKKGGYWDRSEHYFNNNSKNIVENVIGTHACLTRLAFSFSLSPWHWWYHRLLCSTDG